jgi:hypothetical protein
MGFREILDGVCFWGLCCNGVCSRPGSDIDAHSAFRAFYMHILVSDIEVAVEQEEA